MKLWKSTKRLLAIVLVCALLLPNIPVIHGSASDTVLAPPTGISRVVFANSSATGKGDGSSPENAFTSLESAFTALDDASGDAVIIVCGTVYVSSSWNADGKTHSHDGVYYITGKYGTYDYSSTAVIEYNNKARADLNYNGATHYSNITLKSTGGANVMFYSAQGFEWGEGVTTVNGNKLSVYGGLTHAHLTSVTEPYIKLSSGQIQTVMATGDKSSGDTTPGLEYYGVGGVMHITIGGSARVESNISTGYKGLSGGVVLTMNGGYVKAIYASGRAGSWINGNLTMNLNAGTIDTFGDKSDATNVKVSGNITVNLKSDCTLSSGTFTAWGSNTTCSGTKTLNLVGYTGAVGADTFASYDELNVTGNSNATYASTVPSTTAITVDSGSTLTLPAHADSTGLNITNNGTINYSSGTEVASVPIVFVGDTSHANYAKLPAGATVYASLPAAYQALAEDGVTDAYIILFSSTAIGASFNTDGSKGSWTGTYHVTGKYSSGNVSYDFGSDAVIELTPTSGKNFSPSGKQHYSNMKFYHTGSANINFYSSKGITIDDTVTYEQANGAGTMSIYGGEYAAAVSDTIINVYGGQYYSVRSGNSNSTVTNATINIGGNAVITNCIVPGGNNATSPVTKTVVNIEDGQVYQIYNSGLKHVVESLTINWLGGSTTLGLTSHASSASAVDAMKLTLSGAVQFAAGASLTLPTISDGSGVELELVDYTGDVPFSASLLQKVTVSGNSNVNYNETAAATFIVNEGATLNVTKLTQDAASGVITVTNNGGTLAYSGVVAAAPTVVYVDGKGSGTKDGLSVANAVATIQEALALLDKAKGGTVVLCGEVIITATTKLSDSGVTGPVTLTSVYDGVDYHTTNGARLTWGDDKVKIGATENMTIDNLVLRMESTGDTISQYLYSSKNLHITDTVTTKGTGRLKLFVSDIGTGKGVDYQALVEGGTFYQIFVGANAHTIGNATLTIDKNANVVSNVALGGNSSSDAAAVVENVTFNMKGGYVKVIYDVGNSTGTNASIINGNLVMNLTGGAIIEMRDYNGASGMVIKGDIIVNVGSGFACGTGLFGVWSPTAVTVQGQKILNLVDYRGGSMNSLENYDVVNVFGEQVPSDFDISKDATGKVLRVHNYKGLMGLDLSTFAKIKLTGTDSYMTFVGKVPTGNPANPLALIVDDGCTMLIRESANPGVSLAEYAITKLNGGTGEVILGEAAYTGNDLILDVDFNDSAATDASGNNNTGVVSGSPAFVTGYDGGKAIYINNGTSVDATKYVTFADINGLDISKDSYTISFWYHTVNGGNTTWSGPDTTAGSRIDLNAYGHGIVFSNQDTVADSSGMTAVQFTKTQFFATGVTGVDGTHYDRDGMRSVTDDAWHMITISYDRAGNYCVYIDGNMAATNGIAAQTDKQLGINTLVLGADVNGKYGIRNAYLDDVKIYKGAMNAVDVQAHYYIDSANKVIADAETSVSTLGSEYAPYKAEMTTLITTAKNDMATVTGETYVTAVNVYNSLRKDYETFLAAPQNDALLTALLLSDIHITTEGDTNAQRFETVFKDVASLGIEPDVFFNTGDFSDTSSASAYKAAWNTFYELQKKYLPNMAMFLGQGNHEVAYDSATQNYSVTAPIYNANLLDHIQDFVDAGKVRIDSENYDPSIIKVSYGYKDFSGNVVTHNANRGYSYGMTFLGEGDKPDYHIVILNSDYIEQTGRSKDYTLANGKYDPAANFLEPARHGCKFLDPTVEWLDDVMAEYAEDGLPIFVINHFPFIDSCPMSTYSTTVIDDNSIGMQDPLIRAVLAKYEDVFTFSGHLHHNLGIASILEVEDSTTGGSFTQVNMPAIKEANRAYANLPAGWLMFVYEDEVVFRARDYSTGEWLTEFDVVVQLSNSGSLLGDADGDGNVDAYDASLIKQYSVGLIGAEDLNLDVLDLDGDKHVDAYDASLIQKYSVGLIDKFPNEN